MAQPVLLPLPLGQRCESPAQLVFLPLPLGEGWGEGGLGKVYQLFGDELNTLIEQLNESLAT